MRLLSLAAFLLAAAQALAQTAAQKELNELTGAPAGTRCFKSIELTQEMAKHYIGSGICTQQLRPMDPAIFMKALQTLDAIDRDFTSDPCQVQLRLMFRLGREWIADNREQHCAETSREMAGKQFFREFVR